MDLHVVSVSSNLCDCLLFVCVNCREEEILDTQTWMSILLQG